MGGGLAQLHVLRVFCDRDGRAGNPLGVFLNATAIPAKRRQRIADELGFSETVFVDSLAQGRVRIHTPLTELGFAGHPLVGASWLLAQNGFEVATLQPPAGSVMTWHDADATWIVADPEVGPPWQLLEVPSPRQVDMLTGPPEGLGAVMVWAWKEQSKGHVRARVFASDFGVSEDEATGSAALKLASQQGRTLCITQGVGSELRAKPYDRHRTAVGGRVVLDAVRSHPLD